MSVVFGIQGVWGIPTEPLVLPSGFVAARYGNEDWATALIVDGNRVRCVILVLIDGVPTVGDKAITKWEVIAARWDDASLEKLKLAFLSGWEPGEPLDLPDVQELITAHGSPGTSDSLIEGGGS